MTAVGTCYLRSYDRPPIEATAAVSIPSVSNCSRIAQASNTQPID